MAKMNALNEPQVIRALYAASQAGVRIDLIVRGACSLRPGVPGISDNIHVRSIVGRFLEHSRVYWFANGGEAELLCGSADWLERNLLRRVETGFVIIDPRVAKRIETEVLENCLADNTNAWELQSDGRYLVNGRTLAISPEYLTNDMRIAGQAGAQFNAAEKVAQVKTSQSPMDFGAAARKADADGAAARTAEAVQARAVAEASAAAEKQRAIAEHRQAIAALEAKKKTWSQARYIYTTHQRFLNEINDDIVKHQQELFRLGVGGASLERS